MASSARASKRAISAVSLTKAVTLSIDAILIAGPTTSGKSRAALELAREIGGAIVNADSMQVYREPRILTARPSDGDSACVPHLLYGHVPAREHYSTGRYQSDAGHALTEVRKARARRDLRRRHRTLFQAR